MFQPIAYDQCFYGEGSRGHSFNVGKDVLAPAHSKFTNLSKFFENHSSFENFFGSISLEYRLSPLFAFIRCCEIKHPEGGKKLTVRLVT